MDQAAKRSLQYPLSGFIAVGLPVAFTGDAPKKIVALYLLELCPTWPAVTPPTLLWRHVHPPTNRKAPHAYTARERRTACERVSAYATGV